MAKRISSQTKREVVASCRNGAPFWQIAQHYGISETSVRRIFKAWEDDRYVVRPWSPVRRPMAITYDVFDKQKRKTVASFFDEKEAEDECYRRL